jgi:hypothetical protein
MVFHMNFIRMSIPNLSQLYGDKKHTISPKSRGGCNPPRLQKSRGSPRVSIKQASLVALPFSLPNYTATVDLVAGEAPSPVTPITPYSSSLSSDGSSYFSLWRSASPSRTPATWPRTSPRPSAFAAHPPPPAAATASSTKAHGVPSASSPPPAISSSTTAAWAAVAATTAVTAKTTTTRNTGPSPARATHFCSRGRACRLSLRGRLWPWGCSRC